MRLIKAIENLKKISQINKVIQEGMKINRNKKMIKKIYQKLDRNQTILKMKLIIKAIPVKK